LFRFKHGTLYPILHRLDAEGLIKGSWAKGEGRRKKVYSLTAAGRRHLSGGTSRVQEITSGLLRVLRGPGEVPA
ncbi:MAG: helix-turn-helix transcriptional regulator, partial [Gemmatimonadota bacterium]